MVFVEIGEMGKTILPTFLRTKGIQIFGRDRLRLVTHLDVSRRDIEIALKAFNEFLATHQLHS